jgi:hypothetical protein
MITISSCYVEQIHDPPIPNSFRVEFRIPLPSSIRQLVLDISSRRSTFVTISGSIRSQIPHSAALITTWTNFICAKTAAAAPTACTDGGGRGSGRDIPSLLLPVLHQQRILGPPGVQVTGIGHLQIIETRASRRRGSKPSQVTRNNLI